MPGLTYNRKLNTCRHWWNIDVIGRIVFRHCVKCGKVQYRSHDDEEWTDVEA